MEVCKEHWKKVFKKHFSDHLMSKSNRFYHDISCAVLGIKPAHLLDYIVPPDPVKLQAYLQELLNPPGSCDRSQDLCILLIEQDVLFINYTSLLSLGKINRDATIFVDITSDLKKPVLIKELQTFDILERSLSSCIEVMDKHFCSSSQSTGCSIPILHHNSSSSSVTVQAQGENVCTLFGWLLGYPVVYWFDPVKGYSLVMETLVRHSLLLWRRKGVNTPASKEGVNTNIPAGKEGINTNIPAGKEDKTTQGFTHTLFSFTTPECVLSAEVQGTIDCWYSRVQTRANGLGFRTEMKTDRILLPTVLL